MQSVQDVWWRYSLYEGGKPCQIVSKVENRPPSPRKRKKRSHTIYLFPSPPVHALHLDLAVLTRTPADRVISRQTNSGKTPFCDCAITLPQYMRYLYTIFLHHQLVRILFSLRHDTIQNPEVKIFLCSFSISTLTVPHGWMVVWWVPYCCYHHGSFFHTVVAQEFSENSRHRSAQLCR